MENNRIQKYNTFPLQKQTMKWYKEFFFIIFEFNNETIVCDASWLLFTISCRRFTWFSVLCEWTKDKIVIHVWEREREREWEWERKREMREGIVRHAHIQRERESTREKSKRMQKAVTLSPNKRIILEKQFNRKEGGVN